MTDHKEPAAPWPENKVLPGGDITLRVGGKPFRCGCGCNVFQHPEGEPDIYRCNSCGVEYEAHD